MQDQRAYWRRNLLYLGVLLVVWFTVSFGLGILFVEPLNAMRLPGTGFKLGFWFAQQGSIYVFVVLICLYVLLMNHLDRRFGVGQQRSTSTPIPGAGPLVERGADQGPGRDSGSEGRA